MSKLLHLQLPVFCALVMAATSARAQAPSTPDFELPSDSRVPFLVMRQTPGELAGENTLELRVFADGRCELERPPVMRGAGRHVFQLPPGRARQLARQALDAGLAELDVPALRASLRAAEARRSEATAIHRFDDDVLELELRLDRYRPQGGALQQGLENRVRFVGLRGDRAKHPNDERVRRLSELRETLDSLVSSGAPLPDPAP
jgi:hypothetical protein